VRILRHIDSTFLEAAVLEAAFFVTAFLGTRKNLI
jgi:hypothetical protein